MRRCATCFAALHVNGSKLQLSTLYPCPWNNSSVQWNAEDSVNLIAIEPPPQDVDAKKSTLDGAAVTLAALAIIFLLRYGQEFFIPIVLAILIAYALDPIVAR